MTKLTHITESGDAQMVDVSDKDVTRRIAVGTGRVRMQPATIDLIRNGTAEKGNVLGTAQIAGIMAAKNTSTLIPMCHPLMLTGVDITFDIGYDAIDIRATVKTTGKTGVEMEALTAVGVAALTIYDMVKAVDRGMVIEAIQLESKAGGASGSWMRSDTVAMVCDDNSCMIDQSAGGGIDLQALATMGIAESPTGDNETIHDS